MARVLDCLPPGWACAKTRAVERLYSVVGGGTAAGRGARRFHLLYADAARLARTPDADALFDALESDLKLYVAEHARGRLFVHAGVVGWRGRAVLIPGRSHSGKTTLVAELVRAGADYYSDEYAVLDGRGRVHPYARPLCVRRADDPRPARLTAEELGGRAGTGPLSVGAVLHAAYRPGARWRPRQLSAGQGALALLENTVAARSQPSEALATILQAVRGAKIFKGPRGEASHLVDAVLDLITV